MRRLLRVLLILILLIIGFGLLTLALGPLLLISTNPAPGVADARSVASADSRFIGIDTAGVDTVEIHYFARPGPSTDGPPDAASIRPTSPTFVLLHGFTFNLFTWNRLLGLFERYGSVIAYDQIPYGLSAKPLPAGPDGLTLYSKAAALERLFALLDAFDIEQAILVGNSSGGTLALEAALADPDRISGLVLIAPWVHSKRPILPNWLVGVPQIQRLTLGLARHLGTTNPLLDYSYADPSIIDEERRALTGAHRLLAGWDRAWSALLQRSLTDPVTIAENLGRIEQPTLVLTGDADQVVPESDTQATAAALPNAVLVELPGCGHLPQEECPEQVEAAVSEWLQASALAPSPDPIPIAPH